MDMPELWLPTQPDAGALSLVPLLTLVEDTLAADTDTGVALRARDWGASFDVDELREDAALGFPLLRRLHAALERIEARSDVVMHVDGRCIGPAFALAAACDTRVGTHARLGTSEVRYGIPPLLDLTRRALARLPADTALKVLFHGCILDGRLWPEQATPKSDADRAADTEVIAGFRPRPVASALPAPVTDVYGVLLGAVDAPPADRLETELKALGVALADPAARANQARLHQIMTRDLFAATVDAGKTTPPKIVVLGTGQMGSTIAAATAAAGIDVTVVGRSQAKAEAACAAAAKSLRHLERRGPFFVDADAQQRFLHPSTEVPGNADGVIEAVLEDVDVKRERFDLARAAAPSAWLATTSSSIPLDALGDDVALLHYGYPAEVSPVVEVAYPPTMPGEDVAAMAAYISAVGHAGAETQSVPGYVVSRLLFTYGAEAIALCDEGVAPDAIDAAAMDAGFMLGPLGIVDAAACDLVMRVLRDVLVPAYGDRFAPGESLLRLVEIGDIGRGAGRGFFVYEGDVTANPVVAPAEPARTDIDAETIAERLVLAVVSEAERLVTEAVAAPAEIDLLATTCVRFPAATGGPLALLQDVGNHRLAAWSALAETGNPRLALPALTR